MKAGIVIDISHLILHRQIKRQIKAQLKDLGIIEHFHGECAVKFVNGKPKYIGYIWDRYSGEQVMLGPDFNVTHALIDRVVV